MKPAQRSDCIDGSKQDARLSLTYNGEVILTDSHA